MLKPGHRIGNYEIRNLLGDGGMAVVYRATHVAMGTDHAVKVLLSNLALNPKTVERFRQEARAQFRLRHPNIVQVTDYVETEEAIALIMDLVQGMTLRAAMDQRPGPWPVADVVAVMAPVLDAVAHAHRKGLDGAAVVHRDLKPENILLELGDDLPWPGIPKVADFGIAKVMGSVNIATRTNARMGTVPFMSPEQFKSAKDVDARADVWALGMMLWQLLAGRLPVDADDNMQLLKLYEGMTPVPPLVDVVPGVPLALSEAVEQALSVDVGGRFADAWPLLRAMESAAAVKSVRRQSVAAAEPVAAAVAPVKRAATPPRLSAVAEVDKDDWPVAPMAAPSSPRWAMFPGGLAAIAVIVAVVALAWPAAVPPAVVAPPAAVTPSAVTAPTAPTPPPVAPVVDNAPKTDAEVKAMPTFDGDASRFVANGDGTLKDSKLGLVWQQADSGKDLKWADAKAYCVALEPAGGGWRLPTVAELRSLVDTRREEGKRIAEAFNNSNPFFWSATACQPSESNAWSVSFNSGSSNDNDISYGNRVRCVR